MRILVVGLTIVLAACATPPPNIEQPAEQKLINKCRTLYSAMVALAKHDIDLETIGYLEDVENVTDVICSDNGPAEAGITTPAALRTIEGYLEDVVAKQQEIAE